MFGSCFIFNLSFLLLPPLPFILSLFLYTCTYTHFSLCIIITIIDRSYIALFSALEQIHHIHVACDFEWVTASFFIVQIFNIHRSGVLTALFGCCMAGATWNCCRFGTSSVYTIQPCTSLLCDFIQSHLGRVHVCLAVTCHLHFWRNDCDLLRATAVRQRWNGYQNKSQHKVDPCEENSPAPPLGTRDLPITSLTF